MKLEAFYSVKSKNTETGEISTLHEQKNLITDYGLNYFGTDSKTKTTKTNWNLNACGVWLKDFPDPTVQLEELYVPYKSGSADLDIRRKFLHNAGDSGSSSQYSVKGFDDGLVCYVEQKRTYTFPHKYIVGDMYGIYLGCFDNYGDYVYYPKNDLRVYPWVYSATSSTSTITYDYIFSIFSAIKFKDATTGLNKSIPVSDIEQIFIEYTIRRYLPKYTRPKVYNITTSMGTQHKVTVKPKWDTGTYYNPVNDVNNYRSPFAKFDSGNNTSDLGYVNQITFSDGTTTNYYESTNDFTTSILSYKNNSYKQGAAFYYDLNGANKSIKDIAVGCNMGTMQVTFDPPVLKTIERKFNFALEWNWGRDDTLQISRDALAVSNHNFSIDLSDWTFAEVSAIIRNEVATVPYLYFSKLNSTESFSQVIDLSAHILTNRRLSVLWDGVKKGSSVDKITIEYMDETNLITHTQEVTSIVSADSTTSTRSFSNFNIDTAAINAQKMRLIFRLKTGTAADSFIGMRNIQVYITNMTPIEI